MVTSWMKETYDQFTQRVMTTREGKIKDIDAVARGRIFLARQAKDLGMVDEIGGIDDALAYAAKRSDLEAGQYDVKVLPAPKTLADYLNGTAAAERDSAAFPFQPKVDIGADTILKALSPQLRKELGRELQMVQLLQDRPVILVAPYTLTVR
jgi:protease-4